MRILFSLRSDYAANLESVQRDKPEFRFLTRGSICLLLFLLLLSSHTAHKCFGQHSPPRTPHLHPLLSTRTHLLSFYFRRNSVMKTVRRKFKLQDIHTFFIQGDSSLDFFPLLRSVLTGGGSAKRDTENGIGTKSL